MSGPKNEFTKATSLDAEAIGEPGNRVFRILVNSGDSSATLWLEKSQLFELALTMNHMLAILPRQENLLEDPPHGKEVPSMTQLSFTVGRLTLIHHASSGHFTVDAHAPEDEEDSPAMIRIWINKSQVAKFAKEALQLCEAGRPVCPQCGGPIDLSGHFCPRSNGHHTNYEP